MNFPRAILHVDGDSFFAACEVARDPSLQGRPVITGRERGIASALTYEAKARGITRGMRLSEIKQLCPEAVILPSDYETYSLYARRMYELVRQYTDQVEEYSIDECFAELTGLDRSLKISYQKIAESLKAELQAKLGLTFSLGLAPNKVLAKVASNWQKPDGLTDLLTADIPQFLRRLPVEKIWGIGPRTSKRLNNFGLRSAYDLYAKDPSWINLHLTKPHREIWQELHGRVVFEPELAVRQDLRSISKTKTFTPPSSDYVFVLAQLSKNIENACIKARRHGLEASAVRFFLKTQDFQLFDRAVILKQATAVPTDILKAVGEVFDTIYRPGRMYRASGVVLEKLEASSRCQPDLFGQTVARDKQVLIFDQVDTLRNKYGKHTVFLGSSFSATGAVNRSGDRIVSTGRQVNFKGESKRRRLNIPFLGEVY